MTKRRRGTRDRLGPSKAAGEPARPPTPKPLAPFVGLLVVAVGLSFLPCLFNGFVNWDDQGLVVGNPMVREFSWQNILHAFTSFYVSTYIPLPLVSFMAEHALSGLNPFLYHLDNVLLHAATTVLVFLLVRAWSGNPLTALVAGLLFGLHPLRVESVAWITERKDVLYGVFYVASLLLYERYSRQGGRWTYASALGAFALSLLSKGLAVTLPLVLVLYEFTFRGATLRDRRVWARLAPYFLLAAAVGWIAIVANAQDQISPEANRPLFPLRNLPLAGYVTLFLGSKVLFPVRLSNFYPFPESARSLWSAGPLIAAILVTGIVAWLIRMRKTRPTIWFGGLFFLIALLPVTQLFPVAGSALAADRFTYIPSIGISYIAASGFSRLWNRTGAREGRRRAHIALTAGMAVVACTLAVLTFNRCLVWKNSVTLWSDAVSRYPDSPVALRNRADAYLKAGAYRNAVRDADAALKTVTTDRLLYFTRGLALMYEGDAETALTDFNRALDLNPNDIDAYNNRGLCYTFLARYDEALADFDRALAINPAVAIAEGSHSAIPLHFTFASTARSPSFYTSALEATYVDVHNNRGNAQALRGQYQAAIDDYTAAIRLRPDRPESYVNRGRVRMELGLLDDAVEDLTRAIQINPRLPNSFQLRAQAYARLGDSARSSADISAMRALGATIEPEFLEQLQKDTQNAK